MSEPLGLLFADGSILVLPEGTGLEAAHREADEHDQGEEIMTRVARLEIDVLEIVSRTLPA
jgi:hypothetical protein